MRTWRQLGKSDRLARAHARSRTLVLYTAAAPERWGYAPCVYGRARIHARVRARAAAIMVPITARKASSCTSSLRTNDRRPTLPMTPWPASPLGEIMISTFCVTWGHSILKVRPVPAPVRPFRIAMGMRSWTWMSDHVPDPNAAAFIDAVDRLLAAAIELSRAAVNARMAARRVGGTDDAAGAELLRRITATLAPLPAADRSARARVGRTRAIARGVRLGRRPRRLHHAPMGSVKDT